MKYIGKLVIIFILSLLVGCKAEKRNIYDDHDESMEFVTIEHKKIDIQKI